MATQMILLAFYPVLIVSEMAEFGGDRSARRVTDLPLRSRA
jgi:hypothetical protein